ncbi:hypothetical protein C8R43DRAFT_966261, partial [Mycena crocata]
MSSTGNSAAFADSLAHHNRLSRLYQYVAVAAVVTAHGWAKEGPANILRERSASSTSADGPPAQYAYLTVVGRVSGTKCYVGPAGSFNRRFNDPLEKAKYTFMLERPANDPVFSAAWDDGLRHLRQVESGACDGQSANFFVADGGETLLRFTKPVFEKKGGDNPPDVDTSRWPVGSANADLLLQTAKTHDARVFPLYDRQDRPVTPLDVEKLLPGSMVEVSFRMIHYGFSRNGNNIDSMTGEVAQVLTLRDAPPRPKTLYTRKGVFRPAPSLPAVGQPSATAPNSVAAGAPVVGQANDSLQRE